VTRAGPAHKPRLLRDLPAKALKCEPCCRLLSPLRRHLMSELEDAADHLVVVGHGQVFADASVRDMIAAAADDRVELRTAARGEARTVLAHAGATVARRVLTCSQFPAFPRNG